MPAPIPTVTISTRARHYRIPLQAIHTVESDPARPGRYRIKFRPDEGPVRTVSASSKTTWRVLHEIGQHVVDAKIKLSLAIEQPARTEQ